MRGVSRFFRWAWLVAVLVALVACGGAQHSASGTNDSSPGVVENGVALRVEQLQKAAAINATELASSERTATSEQRLALPKSVSRVPVYRFYNRDTAAHFYTISEAERAQVQATLPVFSFEGVAFYVSSTADASLSPVYRFINAQTGVHFYSISAEEKAHIEANVPQFRYEGVAYHASKVGGAGMVPLYRFYQNVKGFHFYTVSQVESDTIRTTLAQYTFENVGYYVMGPRAPSYTLGGALNGLTAGRSLVLQNNGGDDLTLSANGNFLFASPLNLDSPFNVSVKTQPVGQTCSVSGGAGTVSANVASVLVSCVTNQYTVGGTVSGLEAGRFFLLSVANRARTVNANGAFTLTGFTVPHGAAYSASILSQPAGQTCFLANATGTALTNVTALQITCTSNTYTVGGSVSGLGVGKSVTISLNMGEQLVLTGNAPFVFQTTLAYNTAFMVNVRAHPPGQVCTLSSSSLAPIRNNVTDMVLTCIDTNHSVGGTVSGLLAGRTLVLQNNAGNDLTVSASGAFAFSTRLNTGTAYNVTVRAQPLGQACSVINGSGTATAQVSNVQVSCAVSVYSVGGSISGLGAGKTLVLQNNAGDDLSRTQNGNFGFTQLLPYGSPYAVSIRTQPVDQTCTVSNGIGSVAGQVSNVSVNCVDQVTVGGNVAGLINGNRVVLTLNGGGDLTVNANGGFVFGIKTPIGATYVVSVKTQPAGQTCTASNATGTANAAVGNVSVSCANNVLSDLVISEVGGCPYSTYAVVACWLEVFNPTATPRNLSNYRLRTAISGTPAVFSLPSASVAPGEYRILAANLNLQAPATALNPVVMVGDAGGVPVWGDWSGTGLVELVAVANNATVDAVRFGNSATAPQPLTAGHWSGAAVTTLFAGGESDLPRSLIRPLATVGSQDTQSALDWVAVEYPTPGGPNDVGVGAVDADSDGLPDGNELPGTTYNGLNIYAMGARANQRDIFLELDHMDSATVVLAPHGSAMQTLKDVFAAHGFALHIDIGSVLAAGFDPAQFNLGQGTGKVPYEACVGWSAGNCVSNTSPNYRIIYDWKWQHFDVRRRAIFHYGLIGDRSAGGESGRGELFGNDFAITSGSGGGGQVGLIMHEFGHNLGLSHGGNEVTQYKPNYLSVMNYMYVWDVPPQGNSVWPFRKWKYFFGNSTGMRLCNAGDSDPNCAVQYPYSINYSDGGSLPLNEGALYESANVGRGALPGVYADWDENGSLTATSISRDLNQDGQLSVLTDHNDWAAITLPFARTTAGQLMHKSFAVSTARKAAKVPTTGATVPWPVLDDQGPTVVTCGADPRGAMILQRLRRASGSRNIGR